MRVPAGRPVGPPDPELDVLLHTGPFHAAFRAAVRARGLTLQRLQARLASRGIRLALENCRVGQVLRHPSGVLVAEVLFGETLRVGDTWVFEYRVDDGTGAPATEYAHGFRLAEEQLVMEARFHPCALPVDCHAFAQPGLYDPRYRTAD